MIKPSLSLSLSSSFVCIYACFTVIEFYLLNEEIRRGQKTTNVMYMPLLLLLDWLDVDCVDEQSKQQ